MKKRIIGAALLISWLHTGDATAVDTLRKTISLDQGWRFKKGAVELPGRTPVSGWRYRLDSRGEASAKVMAAPGLDTSGKEWVAGSLFDARAGKKEASILQGWLAVGDMNRDDAFLPAWFRAELPGKSATRPVLECSRIHRIAHVYVNGVKLARHEGQEEEFTVDLRKVWKQEGSNSVAVLIEGVDGWGTLGEVKFVDLDKVEFPVTSPISPDYDDSGWRTVDVPHDYIVEGEIMSRGGGDGYTRVPAIYRKVLTKPELAPGGRVWLEFDGVYRMSHYWINGKHVDVHGGGFVLNRIDVTDALKPGANSLVVSVNPSPSESGFDGAGITRHVRMVAVAPVHVAPDSVFVTAAIPDPKDGVTAPAVISISAAVNNTGKSGVNAELIHEVIDAGGHVVQTGTQRWQLVEGETAMKQSLQLPEAKLWSCEQPVLYTLRTTIKVDGQPVDRVLTPFGIRKIEFDAERGFLLNGKVVKIKGVCSRPNHAGVGHAMPLRLTEWRLEQIKKMGGNAWRCSHYAFEPEFYDACDRMGILVMDEFRSFGDGCTMLASDKTTADTLENQTIQVKRHRNHPSIIMWSVGNEGGAYQNKPSGGRIARSIKKRVDALDGTRPTTYANNGSLGPGLTPDDAFTTNGVSGAVDVVGVNYTIHLYDKIHARYPGKPMVGTEACSELGTRGCYDRTQFKNKMRGPDLYGNEALCQLSAYSENRMGWSATCEAGWKAVIERPWMMGYFVWSGFDYQGEPTPFVWPGQAAISTQFGIMDTCGFPKDSYWYYKSWWGSEPVIHVFPHWNWPGKEGQEIPVWVHSNCDEVELFLNGKSLGKKKMERNGHLEWSVPYAPGKLEAKGLLNNTDPIQDGSAGTPRPTEIQEISQGRAKPPAEPLVFRQVAKGSSQGRQLSAVRETTGVPTGIALAPDRSALTADGADLAWVGVSVVDDQGRVVPTAGNMIRFSVKGPGKVLGVGNGDPTCHESVKASQRSAFNGLCMVLVQTTRTAGEILLAAESDGLKPATIMLKSNSAQAPPGAGRPRPVEPITGGDRRLQGPNSQMRPDALRSYVATFNSQRPDDTTEGLPQDGSITAISNAQAAEWMERNVPLFECSDKDIEETYYFRWWAYRKHIWHTPDGFVVTEFLPKVGWSKKYNTINCPVGHQLYEGRWIRDSKIMNDYTQFHFGKGGDPGGTSKQYSQWITDAIYARYLVNADKPFVTGLMDALVKNHEAWKQGDPAGSPWQKSRLLGNGLYWQVDSWEGQEFSIGGTGIRPPMNSYMYGETVAIARIAELAGRKELADHYQVEADQLRKRVQAKLWDSDAKFFKVMRHEQAPMNQYSNSVAEVCAPGQLVKVREIFGLVPWYFNLPEAGRGYEEAWRQLTDPQGFLGAYGPTVAERRDSRFFINAAGCMWCGASWPFSTAQTLTALANVLNNYRQDVIGKKEYFDTLKAYTRSHRLTLDDGKVVSWLDESLNPDTGRWIKVGPFPKTRGRDYNHSTYCDLVITGLVGLRPRADDLVEVNPLVPEGALEYFCLDNVSYHGRNLTVIWDMTGKRYGRGAGLSVLADGREIAHGKTLARVTGKLP
jgi:beta-galactosidase